MLLVFDIRRRAPGGGACSGAGAGRVRRLPHGRESLRQGSRKLTDKIARTLPCKGPQRSQRPETPLLQTRPEIKKLLEDMKLHTPRIPLPELTAEEKAKLGERGGGYDGRVRSLYLNFSDGRSMAAGFSRDPDPNMSLDYAFKTMLFWIVSRTNNCHY